MLRTPWFSSEFFFRVLIPWAPPPNWIGTNWALSEELFVGCWGPYETFEKKIKNGAKMPFNTLWRVTWLKIDFLEEWLKINGVTGLTRIYLFIYLVVIHWIRRQTSFGVLSRVLPFRHSILIATVGLREIMRNRLERDLKFWRIGENNFRNFKELCKNWFGCYFCSPLTLTSEDFR